MSPLPPWLALRDLFPPNAPVQRLLSSGCPVVQKVVRFGGGQMVGRSTAGPVRWPHGRGRVALPGVSLCTARALFSKACARSLRHWTPTPSATQHVSLVQLCLEPGALLRVLPHAVHRFCSHSSSSDSSQGNPPPRPPVQHRQRGRLRRPRLPDASPWIRLIQSHTTRTEALPRISMQPKLVPAPKVKQLTFVSPQQKQPPVRTTLGAGGGGGGRPPSGEGTAQVATALCQNGIPMTHSFVHSR